MNNKGLAASQETQRSLNLQMDASVAQSRYATMVATSLGENECLITFIAEDPMTSDKDEPVGYGVARIYVSNKKLRSIADLFARQADLFDEREKEARQHAE